MSIARRDWATVGHSLCRLVINHLRHSPHSTVRKRYNRARGYHAKKAASKGRPKRREWRLQQPRPGMVAERVGVAHVAAQRID
jgi:hypothetical protein